MGCTSSLRHDTGEAAACASTHCDARASLVLGFVANRVGRLRWGVTVPRSLPCRATHTVDGATCAVDHARGDHTIRVQRSARLVVGSQGTMPCNKALSVLLYGTLPLVRGVQRAEVGVTGSTRFPRRAPWPLLRTG